jgi:hypothetical protein
MSSPLDVIADKPIWLIHDPATGKPRGPDGIAKNWPKKWTTRALAEAGIARHGGGLTLKVGAEVSPGVWLVAIDADDAYVEDERQPWVDEVMILLDGCYVETSRTTGLHILFLAEVPDHWPKRIEVKRKDLPHTKPAGAGFELEARSGKALALTGRSEGDLRTIPLDTLVEVRAIIERFAPLPSAPDSTTKAKAVPADARELLDHIDGSRIADREQRLAVLGGLHHATGGAANALDAFIAWNAKHGRGSDEHKAGARRNWKGLRHNRQGGATIGTLHHLAAEHDPVWYEKRFAKSAPREEPPAHPGNSEPVEESDATPLSKSNGGQPKRGNPSTGAEWRKVYVPLEYAIDGLIVRGQIVSLTGKTGHGKTTCVLSVLGHVANGKDYLGRATPKGHVALIAAENIIGTLSCYIAMVDHWPGFDESHFHILTVDQPTSVEDLRHELHQYAQRLGIKFTLVAADSASALFPGDDINDNVQQRDFAADLCRLKLLPGNPGGIVLCHPHKNPKGPADLLPVGGGLFVAELDGNFTLWRTDDIVEVSHTKLRMPTWEPFKLKLVETTATSAKEASGQPLRAVTVEPVTEAEQERETATARTDVDKIVLALAKATPLYFTSPKAIAIAAGIILPTVTNKSLIRTGQRRVEKAIKLKLIEVVAGYHVLTAKGREHASRLECPQDVGDTSGDTEGVHDAT